MKPTVVRRAYAVSLNEQNVELRIQGLVDFDDPNERPFKIYKAFKIVMFVVVVWQDLVFNFLLRYQINTYQVQYTR